MLDPAFLSTQRILAHLQDLWPVNQKKGTLSPEKGTLLGGGAVTLERTLNISVGCGEQLETADKTGRASHPEVLKA